VQRVDTRVVIFRLQCILLTHVASSSPLDLPKADSLRKGILQADFNDANIVLSSASSASSASGAAAAGGAAGGKKTVTGVIDFGDIVHSYRINDVAIGMAYTMVTKFGQVRRKKRRG